MEVQSLDHWTTGEVQCKLVYIDSQAIFRLILRLICAFNKRILKSIRNPQIYLVEREIVTEVLSLGHWSALVTSFDRQLMMVAENLGEGEAGRDVAWLSVNITTQFYPWQ